jgi:glycosyltransferase involved in cell wall biosynthesis
MKIVHVLAGLSEASGICQVARRFAAAQEKAGDATVFVAPRFKWNPVYFSFAFVVRAVRAVRVADEVWVHGSWTFPVWFGAFLARRFRRRLVVLPHGSYEPRRLRNAAAWKKRLVAPLDRRVLRTADEVLALCDAEVAWIRAFEPFAQVRLAQVPTFYDGVPVRPIAAHTEGRPLRVLFLGRAEDPLKGVRYLRAAVEELNAAASADAPRVELRVESSLFGAAKEAAWTWCDVLCLPTLSENYGLVVAEALEHGVPAVTTDGAPAWRGVPHVAWLDGFCAADDATRVSLLASALRIVTRP